MMDKRVILTSFDDLITTCQVITAEFMILTVIDFTETEILIDVQTANAFLTVYERINEKNKAKLRDIYDKDGVYRVLSFIWKLVGKCRN